MRALTARVARTIRAWQLAGRGDRIAAGVSGGRDSVALAWLLQELAPRMGASLAGLIHVNHQLRGAESDQDEQFCRRLAARLGVPFDACRADVGALARARRLSLEAAARLARYEQFELAAARLHATKIATGHTLDDQAETVMMRLLRGAGARGLSGIRPRRGSIIRPLLECRRDDLGRYLAARGESWREDPSNTDRRIPRNRIRHEVMPVLVAVGPGAIESLARAASLADDDEKVLMDLVRDRQDDVVLARDAADGVVLDAGKLAGLPPALARRMVRLLAASVAPDRAWSARHFEAVRRLAASDKPVGRLVLPGLVARRREGRVELQPGRPADRPAATIWPPRTLEVPGSVDVPEAGATLVARMQPRDVTLADARGTAVTVRADDVPLPLIVRNRKPGDRFRPLGAPGSRKLQDVLVDRKVPREARDAVPVVTDAHGRILWVAGVAVAERGRIRVRGGDVLLLELRKHK